MQKIRICLGLIFLLEALALPCNLLAQKIKTNGNKVAPTINSITITHLTEHDEPKFQGLLVEEISSNKAAKYEVDEQDNGLVRLYVLPDNEFDLLCTVFSDTNKSMTKYTGDNTTLIPSYKGFGSLCISLKYQKGLEMMDSKLFFELTDKNASNYFFTIISKVNSTDYQFSNKARIYLSSYFLAMTFILDGVKPR